jgi:hypothetical protein
MEIISHRGFWNSPNEKNTTTSFVRSFSSGFGTETDIRDLGGELVVSHDMPIGNEMLLTDFCQITDAKNYTLAINIKSDGIAIPLKKIFSQFGITKWFVFDMSIPDTLNHISAGNPVFTRLSDIEPEPLLLNESVGVWLDSFKEDWYSEEIILNLLNKGKQVCIVSPELHGRDPLNVWKMLSSVSNHDDLILCTDYPIKASNFFNNII